MRKFVLMLAVMALGALVLAAPIMAAKGPSAFSTTLTGGEEVPGPGDPDGSGLAEITLVPKESRSATRSLSPVSSRPRWPTSTKRLRG